MKLREIILKMSSEKTKLYLQNKKLRKKPTHFTRKSKLGAVAIITILLGKMLRSCKVKLMNILNVQEEKLCQNKHFRREKHINPEFLREYGDETGGICAKYEEVLTYNGMKLIAVDGSTLAVENSNVLSVLQDT